MKNLFLIAISFILSCTKSSYSDSITPTQHTIDRTAYTISGNVYWEHDDVSGVKDVTITLSGSESNTTITDINGYYEFTVSTSGSYTITPTKSLNLLNGCTTSDVSTIQQHVVGNAVIMDPYKRVAADINKNGTISTVDASILNQTILGNPSAQNIMKPSWKFVDASYVLILPPSNNQVPTGYPESINITISGNSVGNNFIGIKRGDVNGTANPSF